MPYIVMLSDNEFKYVEDGRPPTETDVLTKDEWESTPAPPIGDYADVSPVSGLKRETGVRAGMTREGRKQLQDTPTKAYFTNPNPPLKPDYDGTVRDRRDKHRPMDNGPLGGAMGVYNPKSREVTIGPLPKEDRPKIMEHEFLHDQWRSVPEEDKDRFLLNLVAENYPLAEKMQDRLSRSGYPNDPGIAASETHSFMSEPSREGWTSLIGELSPEMRQKYYEGIYGPQYNSAYDVPGEPGPPPFNETQPSPGEGPEYNRWNKVWNLPYIWDTTIPRHGPQFNPDIPYAAG